jgi:hypothetical protein
MNKNEILNFCKSHKNTICLDTSLTPVKLKDFAVDSSGIYCIIEYKDGTSKELPFPSLIGLKGRLKSRDYDTVEVMFHKR